MNLFPFLFGELLLKASAPVPQPKKQVPPPTNSDWENHNNKIHYPQSHDADQVVQRTVYQNPHTSRSLHAYKCPVCHHNRSEWESKGKKHWLVGHKPIGLA